MLTLTAIKKSIDRPAGDVCATRQDFIQKTLRLLLVSVTSKKGISRYIYCYGPLSAFRTHIYLFQTSDPFKVPIKFSDLQIISLHSSKITVF